MLWGGNVHFDKAVVSAPATYFEVDSSRVWAQLARRNLGGQLEGLNIVRLNVAFGVSNLQIPP